MKRIHFFRPGRHTAMSGQTIEFSEADLARAAQVYDPTVHEAPLVVGHPKGDLPAYGGVAAVHVANGDLEAEPCDVDPAFEELVRTKRFGKVSASWYAPGSPQHPLAGTDNHDTWYLRHIGFLGAQPPAVKGLRAVEFGEADEGVVEFGESARFAWGSISAAMRGLREWLIGERGLETADKVLPNFYLSDLEAAAKEARDAPAEVAPSLSPSYSEGDPALPNPTAKTEDLAERQAQLDARQAQLDAREAQLVASERQAAEFAEAQARQSKEARDAQCVAFADGLVTAGQLRPADKPRVVALMQGFAADATVLEFAEGSQTETVAKPALQVLQGFLLDVMPKQVDFSERGNKTPPPEVDMQSHHSITAAAVAFQEDERKAGREVSFEDAVQHVVDERAG